jgi:predicted naringenin-chalcone synthase
MRFINALFTAQIGAPLTNAQLLPGYEEAVGRLGLDDAAERSLREFIRFQLGGERSRHTVVPDWHSIRDFRARAGAFEKGAEEALDKLAPQIAAAAGPACITFDAVLTTTATGNLMPGLSYRLARRLGALVRPESMMLDLGNVGCTGSSKLLKLASSLEPDIRNILVLAVELPTTLIDMTAASFDLWQGNCTFGDGAAALWISSTVEQGPLALAVERLDSRHFADRGLGLIRWGYRDYYVFTLSDYEAFDSEVRGFVTEALVTRPVGQASSLPTNGPPEARQAGSLPHEKDEPRWAIHPAGIALLMRLSRKLGIPMDAIRPSMDHYRAHSNMSSVSILHLLGEIAGQTPVGSAINLLTMGAGFEVLHGRVRRLR